MAGVKGRSGRKRNIRNIQKYYNEQFDLRSASLIETLLDEASKGNAAALVYAFDRRFGKPKQQTDLDLGEGFGVGVLVKLLGMIEAPRLEITEGREEQEGVNTID